MQKLGDVCPLVPIDFVSIEYDPFLFIIYWRLLDAGIQMVVPPLPALLPSPAAYVVFVRQLLSNECPPLGPIFGYQVNNSVIFLLKCISEVNICQI